MFLTVNNFASGKRAGLLEGVEFRRPTVRPDFLHHIFSLLFGELRILLLTAAFAERDRVFIFHRQGDYGAHKRCQQFPIRDLHHLRDRQIDSC
jgi:hypothetical protein